MTTKGLEVRAYPLDRNIHHIDPMILLKGLLITVPNDLREIIILINFHKFIDSSNENSTTHVERFIDVLVISLVIDHDYYYLIWFPSTLVDSGYV